MATERSKLLNVSYLYLTTLGKIFPHIPINLNLSRSHGPQQRQNPKCLLYPCRAHHKLSIRGKIFLKYCDTEKAQWMICNPFPRPNFYKRFEIHEIKLFFSFFRCTWMSFEYRLIIRRFSTCHSKGNQPNKLSIFMNEGLI